MTRTWAMLLILGAAGWQLPAADGGRQIVQVTKTETVPFQPGGTIHFNRSFGYLSVEGWDRPEVEVTVVKTLSDLRSPQEQAESAKQLDKVRVMTEKKSDTDLEISTAVPKHNLVFHTFDCNSGVGLEYQIHAPRNSKLVIHHRSGDVMVTHVTGDIEVTGHAGDIVVMLPEAGKYAIDADTRIGSVWTDFGGEPKRRHWVGRNYVENAAGPVVRIYLRMGLGGITIQESPKSAQPPTVSESR